ncbi:hypothetical protein AAG570_010517 [Ranatra chinensis]|uniref:Uncharacterized protein n=1 Tax=Ranatra chinensis TaxID=642074 RepID=A0ABD0YN17_9HEMI
MSNEYSDIIRTIVREGHNQEREKRRGDMYNKSRIIGNDATFVDKIFDENDIKRLVKEMRRSSGCKEAVLSSLKNAFIQDRSNMITFLKIEGSLHAVVGKLMNTNPVIQLLAAECCCNLSLGDAKTCHQLAKSATAYLVASLQGMNYNLMVRTGVF